MKKPKAIASPLAKMVGVKSTANAPRHPHTNLGKYLHPKKGC
jgi:hypothetical protein